jgi:hypothetical protein
VHKTLGALCIWSHAAEKESCAAHLEEALSDATTVISMLIVQVTIHIFHFYINIWSRFDRSSRYETAHIARWEMKRAQVKE